MCDTDSINTLYLRAKLKALLETSVDYTPKEFARTLARLAYKADPSSAVITLQEIEKDKAIHYRNKK